MACIVAARYCKYRRVVPNWTSPRRLAINADAVVRSMKEAKDWRRLFNGLLIQTPAPAGLPRVFLH